jgi:hypothetical protein
MGLNFDFLLQRRCHYCINRTFIAGQTLIITNIASDTDTNQIVDPRPSPSFEQSRSRV